MMAHDATLNMSILYVAHLYSHGCLVTATDNVIGYWPSWNVKPSLSRYWWCYQFYHHRFTVWFCNHRLHSV